MCRGPECFERGKVTEKADIWALGCTLLEICSGAVFPAGTETAVIMKQVLKEHRGPDIPGDVPDRLAAVIRHCLQIDPQKRPTAAQVRQVGHDSHVHKSRCGSVSGQHCRTPKQL